MRSVRASTTSITYRFRLSDLLSIISARIGDDLKNTRFLCMIAMDFVIVFYSRISFIEKFLFLAKLLERLRTKMILSCTKSAS